MKVLLIVYSWLILPKGIYGLTNESLYTLYIRPGRYWQIGKHEILISLNSIEMRWSNTVFMTT